MKDNFDQKDNLKKNSEKSDKNIENTENSGEKIDIMIENNTQQPPELPLTNNTQPTQNPINASRALELLCQLYNNTRVVDMIVQQLANISPRYYGELSRLNNENLFTQAVYSWQYFDISGMKPPRPRPVIPILNNNFCSGLQVLDAYITQMITKNLELNRYQSSGQEIQRAYQGLLKEKEILNNLQNNC